MKSSAGDADVELLKAVAQAWHAQSGNPRPSRASEAGGGDSNAAAGAGARPRVRHRPSRFKLEAMAAAAAAAPPREAAWDFAQSLWDTYELVAVTRNSRVRPRHCRPRRCCRHHYGGAGRAAGSREVGQGERAQAEELVPALHAKESLLRNGYKENRMIRHMDTPASQISKSVLPFSILIPTDE
ncbi:unnamed protein product [Urochloa humidicola]